MQQVAAQSPHLTLERGISRQTEGLPSVLTTVQSVSPADLRTPPLERRCERSQCGIGAHFQRQQRHKGLQIPLELSVIFANIEVGIQLERSTPNQSKR